MKKIGYTLAFTAFFAFYSNAQTKQTTTETKQEQPSVAPAKVNDDGTISEESGKSGVTRETVKPMNIETTERMPNAPKERAKKDDKSGQPK